ncbi:MAG TPA: D-alanyl-D-alanine carboxypeptidase/D-alanyl-D-alanine-endopeptidase [Rhodocyclaceae bacterium]|nr:D-alanyl-D-alanine carboxypeptidase/D-alanyl-D-alanine-endopeptidase [Rhodocyclaceae bacterium]
MKRSLQRVRDGHQRVELSIGIFMIIRCAFFSLVALLSIDASAQLPDPVARALKQIRIPEANVTLWVAPAQGGAPRMQHNATQPFNPASVMKTLTTFAALDSFGPAFTWKTDAYIKGDLRDGVLTGDLILHGSGDPSLTWDRFDQLIRDIRSRGVREIHGDVLIDNSIFEALPATTTDFDDQPLRAYNAMPDALLVNFKALSFRLAPVGATQLVRVDAMTPFAPLTIDNRLHATGGACIDWHSGITERFDNNEQGLLLTLNGTLPTSCGEHLLNVTVQDGLRQAAGVFRALWQELGGKWDGVAREAKVPTDAQLLASWQSPPLADVIRDINKFSNNVMARQLYLTLGNIDPLQPANSAQSEKFLRSWLRTKQLDLPGLVLENGSGLSRTERITAKGLGSILQLAWQSPRMPEFVSSLPIAGIDGTARRRFENQPVANHAYFKTGTLNEVMALAGYVLDVQGHWQAVVMIVNDPRAEQAEQAFIKLADWVYGAGKVK